MNNSLEQGLRQAEAALDSFHSKLEAIDATILETSKNARKMGDVDVDNISPKGLNERLAKNSQFVAQLNAQLKEQERINKSLQDQINRLTRVRQRGNQKTSEEIVNTRILRRNADLYAKSVSQLSTEYEKLDAETKILIRRQKELNVLKLKDRGLTQLQENELQELNATIRNNAAALELVDREAGQFHRNVGNYRSGFDGLGFSIAQVTREAPAFANSINTGLMAISNNIPMVVDEINRLRKANVELAKQGKNQQSVLGALGKAFFSYQTLLSLGITLLTVYGEELFDLAFGMTEAEKATEEATKSIEEQNKAIRENITLRRQELSKASEFINSQARELRQILESTFGDTEKQALILAELSERFEDLGVKGAENLKNENILQSARAQAAINLLNIEKLRNELTRERLKVDAEAAKKSKIQEQRRNGELTALEAKRLISASTNTSLERTLQLQSQIQDLEKQNESIFDVKVLELDTDKERNIALEKQTSILQGLAENNNALEKAIVKAFQKGDISADEYLSTLGDIQKAQELIMKELATPIIDFNVFDQLVTPEDEEVLDGLTTRLRWLNDELKKAKGNKNALDFSSALQSSVQILQEVANFGNALTQRRIEGLNQEINLVNNRYAAELNNEQLTEQQRSAIEAERDAKRTQIEAKIRQEKQKQARLDKQLLIGQIIGQTALAVVKALPNIPLSVLVGSIGALQLATAIATPIPAFKDGHEAGTYEGWARINDQKGAMYQELITRKDGTQELHPGRDQLIYMNKGDKVTKASTTQEIINSAIMASLQSGGNVQSNVVAQSFDKQLTSRIEKGIRNGFNGLKYPDVGRQVAKELRLQQRINKA